MAGRAITYLRVSTDRQGKSGLGLEAQREAVSGFITGSGWTLAGEFVEVESGTTNARPQLAKALEACRITGATLVLAKLDRLARNARFLLTIVEGSGQGGVVFCDLPSLPAGPVGKFMLTQMAAVAELEAGLIGQRTKAALAAAKARGTKLGGWRGKPGGDPATAREALQRRADAFAASVRPVIAEAQGRGLSLRGVAAELAEKGIRTAGGGDWTAAAVRAVTLRAEAA